MAKTIQRAARADVLGGEATGTWEVDACILDGFRCTIIIFIEGLMPWNILKREIKSINLDAW